LVLARFPGRPLGDVAEALTSQANGSGAKMPLIRQPKKINSRPFPAVFLIDYWDELE
jgi:hypothetical protein